MPMICAAIIDLPAAFALLLDVVACTADAIIGPILARR